MTAGRPVWLGQYRPGESFLHNLDSRAKVLPIFLVLVLALLTTSAIFYLSVLIALALALAASGIKLGSAAASLRPILWLVAFTVLYHLIFSGGGGRVLFSIAGWDLTQTAVARGVVFSLRLLLFVSIAFLLTLTTSPSDLAEAWARLAAPLRRLRVPVQELAMIVFIAIRFIPILYDEFIAIRNAQKMRGVVFTGSWLIRMRRMTYVIIPVFLAALQRADDLAVAIEARGYQPDRPRSFYSRSTFASDEWIFLIGSTALLLALYFTSRWLNGIFDWS